MSGAARGSWASSGDVTPRSDGHLMNGLRTVADHATEVAGWLRRGARADPGPAPVKVNLGSGLVCAPGWLHVDLSFNALVAPLPSPALKALYHVSGSRRMMKKEEYVTILRRHRFFHFDLLKGIPLPSDAVDFLYSAHFIEHLGAGAAEQLFREAARVLRPDGVFRVTVPDLGQIIARYLDGDRAGAVAELLGDHGHHGKLSDHRSLWDYELLKSALENAGFVGVGRREFRQGDVPDLSLIERREQGVFIEARAPERADAAGSHRG